MVLLQPLPLPLHSLSGNVPTANQQSLVLHSTLSHTGTLTHTKPHMGHIRTQPALYSVAGVSSALELMQNHRLQSTVPAEVRKHPGFKT